MESDPIYHVIKIDDRCILLKNNKTSKVYTFANVLNFVQEV